MSYFYADSKRKEYEFNSVSELEDGIQTQKDYLSLIFISDYNVPTVVILKDGNMEDERTCRLNLFFIFSQILTEYKENNSDNAIYSFYKHNQLEYFNNGFEAKCCLDTFNSLLFKYKSAENKLKVLVKQYKELLITGHAKEENEVQIIATQIHDAILPMMKNYVLMMGDTIRRAGICHRKAVSSSLCMGFVKNGINVFDSCSRVYDSFSTKLRDAKKEFDNISHQMQANTYCENIENMNV